MPDTPDGTVEILDGRPVIRFERHFDRPVEEVWSALTRPEQLKQWVGASEVEIDLVPGGALVTRTTGPQELVDAMIAEGAGEPPFESRDTVLRVEPTRLFEHTFGGMPQSVVRWELAADGQGCLLRLTHFEPPGTDPKDAPRDLAGWHELLDLLARTLQQDGQTQRDWSLERWQGHRDRYQRKLG